MTDIKPVVVGVDGSRAASTAIAYGVGEAKRRETGIRLVHVVPTYAPITPVLAADLTMAGQALLEAARKEAGVLLSEELVETELLQGQRVSGLLHAAERACVVVLGAERRPALERLFTGSASYGVAARAACPVVVVPPTWSGDATPGSVVVGVKSTSHSPGLIRRALEMAAQRHANVVLLHTWELPNEYDDLIAARALADEWTVRAREAMELCLSEANEGLTEVPVEIRVQHGQPARVLQRESAEAELLVLARRHHGFPFGHLGGTGRALLREAQCPVEILPPADEPEHIDHLAVAASLAVAARG